MLDVRIQAGCRLPWDQWSSQDRAVCTTKQQFRSEILNVHVSNCFRAFEKHFYELWLWELSKVVEITGCKKPCSYKEYKLGEERVEPEDLPAGQMKFGLWSSTELTNIETEVLLYPFTSLLAEFGGTLGLFLGFSFITIWDGFQATLVWINKREFH